MIQRSKIGKSGPPIWWQNIWGYLRLKNFNYSRKSTHFKPEWNEPYILPFLTKPKFTKINLQIKYSVSNNYSECSSLNSKLTNCFVCKSGRKQKMLMLLCWVLSSPVQVFSKENLQQNSWYLKFPMGRLGSLNRQNLSQLTYQLFPWLH